ncbi:MAG: DEAD/DEAH box helicase family protein [Bacteroidetes bacterium]|nr:DEAD/DEAH box helicase family protein [Bacteroidota bacterium]
MYLKNYQKRVVEYVKTFLETCFETKKEIEAAKLALPENIRNTVDLNWVETAFTKLNLHYADKSKNGLGEYYPRVCMKIPTGGGKTLLAVEAIREYQNYFARRKTGLVVWIVPSETIYSQTLDKLKDKSNHLRQLLDQSSGGNTIILEKGQRLTLDDIENNLVILFVMIQAISRANANESLKVFQDSGGFESFFPAENRNDLHKKLIEQVPNLDKLSDIDNAYPLVKTSLGNAIRLTNPLIIIDEIHKVYTDLGKQTIDNLNPSLILGLSATPKAGMNKIISITGLDLKEEQMVKLDLHINPPASQRINDWQSMIREIINKRKSLEKESKKYHRNSGVYIRPIALLQAERTGKDQRASGFVHSLDVKEFLKEEGIPESEIAIKTSSQNDIEDVNLFSQSCEIRYIITKEALKEGWDCSFAYILGIIPNVNSNTGTTQLVGRILRQPNASKTGIKLLDESYVYYSQGSSGTILSQISAGFDKEGLEELKGNIITHTGINQLSPKTVKIKQKYKKYGYSFYLPVWIFVTENEIKRRFNYYIDIKSKLDFRNFKISKDEFEKLKNSLSNENKDRKVLIVSLDEKSQITANQETETIETTDKININYLSRRLTEIINNAFVAREISDNFWKLINDHLTIHELSEHFGYIVSEFLKMVTIQKSESEENIFKKYLKDNLISLVVSDEKEGFKIPHSFSMNPNKNINSYEHNLFEDFESDSLNSLEKDVAELLENQEKILWWFRNKSYKGWYNIQGWKENKIHPDFVAAKKSNTGKLEIVYVLESKGEHLEGNIDTGYKRKVIDILNRSKIHKYKQGKFDFGEVNDKIEFYVVSEDDKDREVKELYK